MRGAPTWVCNYAKYVLFGRLIRHKVQSRLLPPRAVHVGVDIIKSFSVFLFCLAMDPIYHYLNRIPRVLSVQGCINDNTIGGPGNNIEWVQGVQTCYQVCRTAGFQIDLIPAGKRFVLIVPCLLPRRLQKSKKAKVSSSSLVIPLPAQPSGRYFAAEDTHLV